eukprot:Nitzschia sp. Nitz4//scaffold15_size197535//114083//119000//NITZ4_001588-RA/size197535-processed-gene-0.80-mRNA-1//-1//CDS//3329537745//2367//frame0
MAPQVKKAKSAFLYYQGDQLSAVRKELGLSMGDAMTELASRWRSLAPEEKQKYLDLETEDRERFDRESAEADALRLEEQEARRKAQFVQEGEEGRSRGARQKLDEKRQRVQEERERRRLQREAEMDEDEIAERENLRALKQREVEERQQKKREEERQFQKMQKKMDKEDAKKAANRLEYLFKQSPIFAKLKMGKGSMEDGDDEEAAKEVAAASKGKDARPHHQQHEEEEEEVEDTEQHVFLTKQPNCIKFGKLKPYQLESLNWMIHLAEKGLNGILADEMGLGKTLQSISILAYHWEYMKVQGPHLIAVPKSTLSNWMNELNRWCPSLRAIRFHGSREERERLVEEFFSKDAAAHDGKRPERQIMDEHGELVDDNSENPRQWDVCVTTYEVCNAEKKVLQRFPWKYLVIDEAHRLKNDASIFEILDVFAVSYRAHRDLPTYSTPLQNNLRELWALLNFLLPDIFASADQFDEWFNLEIDDDEAKKNMISQLHKILRPFMLRRLKADVAKGLPPKTETIIMVGMSRMQKQLYKKLLLRDLDTFTGNNSGKNRTAILNIVMQLRKCCGHPYLFEGVEDRSLDPLGEHLVENCGKLNMVDKLLKRLKERDSRVLIFTQMTRVLDILEDFMVMRGYKYCRIDGNTSYEDRESSIDSFNAPNSEKFCFILSTRAGGLGINLQTADTCILYDSDWNPQQDLQAQDRCHRLGQKKPVSVYRLVSENTIEEKIVERAQQKLKLDAMVVQQGRLKEKDKVSKEEMMAAVRFGADTIFRSEESTITDEDIDVIIQRGAAKTKELTEKIQKAEKGDLLDFRLDGGVSAQTFEGVDYSDKELRDQLRLLAANTMGKRERRPPPTSYNPIMHPKKSMIVNNRRIKLPKSLRLPSMEDHHFYNRERLLELGKLEFETYATLREAGKLPSREFIDKTKTLLPDELGQEKIDLLEEGFGHWTRSQYFHFIKACAKYGRDDIEAIAADMDMPTEEVAPYSVAFWKYGPTELKDEWERNITSIEKGEMRIAKQKKLTALLSKFVSTFDDARKEMVFANKGTTHFSLEQDRALLCAVNSTGYGNWDSVREIVRNDSRLKFQHTVQGMTTAMITKRCDYRMRQMEKELEAREKTLKAKKPPNVIAAQKAIEAVKAMEEWEVATMKRELRGEDAAPLDRMDPDAATILCERLSERDPCVSRLREIEAQVTRAYGVAEEVRESIFRGDQYVNYSNITLKTAGPTVTTNEDVPQELENGELEARVNLRVLKVPECGQCANCTCTDGAKKLCEKRLEVRKKLVDQETKKIYAEHKSRKSNGTGTGKKRKGEKTTQFPNPKKAKLAPAPKKKIPKMMTTASGQVKPRVTSQGNKRMAIPDEVFPDFCRRIGANGTGERMKLINQFAEEHPTVSVRQVTLKLSEITTKDMPGCVKPPEKKGGRAFMFYLRPRYYKYLPEDERPEGWEAYAEMDERAWEKERKAKGNDKSSKDRADSVAESASNASPSVAEEEADETDDEGSQPSAKKMKS